MTTIRNTPLNKALCDCIVRKMKCFKQTNRFEYWCCGEMYKDTVESFVSGLSSSFIIQSLGSFLSQGWNYNCLIISQSLGSQEKENTRHVVISVCLSARKCPCRCLSVLAKEKRTWLGGVVKLFSFRWPPSAPHLKLILVAWESAQHVFKQLNHNYQGRLVAFLKHEHCNNYKLITYGFNSVVMIPT